jgi:G:T/U-mismatch repair DNA glycosylase
MSKAKKHICHDELVALEQGNYTKPIKILVVGTFNPDLSDNEAKWFYGREINEFWFLFPRMLGFASLHPADIKDEREHHLVCKEFCDANNILIVDILKQVNAELKGYTDSEIDKLDMEQVIPFDFKAAFVSNKPEKVIFTWKGNSGKITGVLKKKFIDYLIENNIKYCEMPSASPIYRKGRKAKLNEWMEAYESINH